MHFSFGAIGAVAGWFYAQDTQDEFVVRCVLIGGFGGLLFCTLLWALQRAFILVLKVVLALVVLYYVLYLPYWTRRPILPYPISGGRPECLQYA